jgi:hypothetical protein
MLHYIGFKFLTAVVMMNSFLWDITLCNLLKVSQCFGGTFPPSSGSKNNLRTTWHYIPEDGTLHATLLTVILSLRYELH